MLSAAALLLNVPWFIRQARAFKPPEELTPVEAVEDLRAAPREYVR